MTRKARLVNEHCLYTHTGCRLGRLGAINPLLDQCLKLKERERQKPSRWSHPTQALRVAFFFFFWVEVLSLATKWCVAQSKALTYLWCLSLCTLTVSFPLVCVLQHLSINLEKVLLLATLRLPSWHRSWTGLLLKRRKKFLVWTQDSKIKVRNENRN